MKFKVYIELEHLSGPEQDEETMLDAFCGYIGRKNGAPTPLEITISDPFSATDLVSRYGVKLADDRL